MRCRSALAIFSYVVLYAAASISAADLQVGAAVRVITPDPLLPVTGGMGIPQPTTKKLGEITVRAMVISQADTTVAIVGLDLLGFPGVLGDRVRDQVPRIRRENILIGSTHTHSAPDCYAFPDGKGGHTADLNYIDFVCRETAVAINEAFESRQPAVIRVGTGIAEGKIAYNYYAPDLYDRRMSVIQAVTLDKQPIVTLVNYAIHPEVLGSEQGICSPDAVGPMYERIESVTGGKSLFINGAQGGMVTADNRDLDAPRDSQRAYWEDHRTWAECERIGCLMADQALRIVQEAPWQQQPRLDCFVSRVQFPVDSDVLWQVIQLSPLKYPHDATNRTITVPINLVQLGDTQMLTIPGEALPNIGFYLKRKMKGRHNLLLGLTNDAFGYILTEVDFQSFPRYDYVSRVSLGEKTGSILIAEGLRLAEQAAGAAPPQPDRQEAGPNSR
ncbi:MAG: hypothetical protein R3E01_16320 [Pirellulaceae bacterium]|nr:hypothetical protein [Planctomycetales bacterium]